MRGLEGLARGHNTGGGGGPWPGHAAPTPIRTACSVWPALTTSETQAGSDTVYPPADTNQATCSWIGVIVPVRPAPRHPRGGVPVSGKPPVMVSRDGGVAAKMRCEERA